MTGLSKMQRRRPFRKSAATRAKRREESVWR